MALPRLVLLHGFTQTGRSWLPLLPVLEARFEVTAPDLPGHGGRADVRAGLWEAAELLASEFGPATYLGYSMGARVALHVALAHPELVERLVLISATAGIEDRRMRDERRQEDEGWAALLEREGIDSFLEAWLARPLFASLPRDRAGVEYRLENTAEGLAAALRLMGTGVQDPLWDRLLELAMPVLLVAGERDERFAELAIRLGGWIGPMASLALVPGAGHACHLEQPEEFLQLVVPFLAEGLDEHGHEHDH